MPCSGDSRLQRLMLPIHGSTHRRADRGESPLFCVALAARLVTELCLLVVAAALGVYFAHVVSRTVTMEPHGACCLLANDW